MTRNYGLGGPADPGLRPGARHGATCSARGRAIADMTLTIDGPADDGGPHHNAPPIVNVRHFPRLAAGRHDEPQVHELVRSLSRDRSASTVYAGDGDARHPRGARRGAPHPRAGRGRPRLPLHVRLHGRRPRDREGADMTAPGGVAAAAGESAARAVSPDHFIGGERVASKERFEDISPIDGSVIAEVSRGGAKEADAAVRAAHAAFPAWAALGPQGRAPYLHKLADLIDANVERLAEVECLDMAMLLRSLRARVIARGARNYRAYADLAVAYEERDWRSNGTWNRVQRMPAGPAAVITPWNAPFMLSTWKTAPALAAGCTMVLKPAEWSPLELLPPGRSDRRGGLPARRVQHHPGHRRGGRRRARRASAAAPRVLHRLARDRPPHRRRRRGQPRPVHRRARRQGPADRLRGRRPRRGRQEGRGPVRRLRPSLPRRHAPAGPGQHPRRLPGADAYVCRRARARRPARGRDDDLAADPPRPSRARRRVRRTRAGQR